MKTAMLVVSSFKAIANCESIRIPEKPHEINIKNSQIHKHKKVTNMDVALAQLRNALSELREQDKGIFKQLMTLNRNIERLKEDVKTEEEKRQEYDHEFEYESESDIEPEIEQLFESQLESSNYQILSPINKTKDKVKEIDEISNHERYDSGIMEEDEQFGDKSDTTKKSVSKENSYFNERYGKHNIDERIISPIKKVGFPERSVLVPKEISASNAANVEHPKLHRSQTLQLIKTQLGRKTNFKHRRSLSEDHIKVNSAKDSNRSVGIVNAAFNSTPEKHVRLKGFPRGNLGHISENSCPDAWTIDDVQWHANSTARKIYRHKIPRDKNFNIINSASMRKRDETDSSRKLNSSLTQLNLQGAISNGTIKAIYKSASIANCSTLGRAETGQRSDGFLSKSLSIRNIEPDDKVLCRRTKSSGGLSRSRSGIVNSSWDFQRAFNTQELEAFSKCNKEMKHVERVRSTISLV